jgi:hypothetical protein
VHPEHGGANPDDGVAQGAAGLTHGRISSWHGRVAPGRQGRQPPPPVARDSTPDDALARAVQWSIPCSDEWRYA